MNSEPEPVWPRIRDLPPEEQEPFRKWIHSQTRPVFNGVPREDQDGYYPWDYRTWKLGLPSAD